MDAIVEKPRDKTIGPMIEVPDLRAALIGASEIAVLDVREAGVHARDGHILLSVSVPLSTLELTISELVPRRKSWVVVYDDGEDSLARRAADRLRSLGYRDAVHLRGGTAAWRAAGHTLFTGSHVIGKAFGEFVEDRLGTPHIDVPDLKAKLDRGDNIAILDRRPQAEFRAFSIPGAENRPGAELIHRFYTAVPDPETLVVVNCAGRTRSIIGAQGLINAGVPPPERDTAARQGAPIKRALGGLHRKMSLAARWDRPRRRRTGAVRRADPGKVVANPMVSTRSAAAWRGPGAEWACPWKSEYLISPSEKANNYIYNVII